MRALLWMSSPPCRDLLFVPQCGHRIDAHRFACRQVTGYKRRSRQQNSHSGERQKISWTYAEQQTRQKPRQRQRCAHTDGASDKRQLRSGSPAPAAICLAAVRRARFARRFHACAAPRHSPFFFAHRQVKLHLVFQSRSSCRRFASAFTRSRAVRIHSENIAALMPCP